MLCYEATVTVLGVQLLLDYTSWTDSSTPTLHCEMTEAGLQCRVK